MNILAIDTSALVLSVALAAKTGVFCTEIDGGPSHSELLMECVDSLCKMAGISPSDLNLASCMKGPGSFTGLRIGFSSAKGLAMALGIPMVAIPTLDCLAHPFTFWPGMVLPSIDAKKGRFFTAFYREGKRLTEYMDAAPEAIAAEAVKKQNFSNEMVLLTGYGAVLLFPALSSYFPPGQIRVSPDSRRGKALELLEIAGSAILNGINDIASGPVYIRKSDAEQDAGITGKTRHGGNV